MKKSAFIWMLALFLTWMVNPASGVEYGTDFLETGNPGGWSDSLKTYDEEWSVTTRNTFDVDIWINDLPEELITAGFFLEYDSSMVSIIKCDVYAGSPLGPWDGDMTTIVENPSGPGTYMVIVGNLGDASPDAGGDIAIARIRFEGTSPGETAVTFKPIEGFDTVVGSSATVYDSGITPHTPVIFISQGRQCATEVIYGEYAEEAALLRHFRDNVLMQTQEGRELIKLYYQWSPAIVKAMERDEEFKEEIKQMVDGVLPMIEDAMK